MLELIRRAWWAVAAAPSEALYLFRKHVLRRYDMRPEDAAAWRRVLDEHPERSPRGAHDASDSGDDAEVN
jgi:hypothetical protein